MTQAAFARADDRSRPMTAQEKRVVFASSAGSIFEWYDFFLYGSLASIISKHFFSNVNPTAAYIFTLLAFSAGFAVRPLGAILFGRLGDMVGRKYTFLITILIMGISTFLVGLLPTFNGVGFVAPILLVLLRLLQGLALGGEYGGAAIFVGEHSPQRRRGYYTSWIQTTATLGFLLSLIVVLAFRALIGEQDFELYGWRFPFLMSFALLVGSVWMRLQLKETPAFRMMKAQGRGSRAPVSEAFGTWGNAKIALIALFGGVAGQAVVWYTGQFYALFFLTRILKVDLGIATMLLAGALIIGAPFFLFFGWLSDKIGRKPVILGGCLLAALLYFPIFKGLTVAINPALAHAQATAPVTVVADPAQCSFQFDPIESTQFVTSCDLAKNALASAAVNYSNAVGPAGAVAHITIGGKQIAAFDGSKLSKEELAQKRAAFEAEVLTAIEAAGYPAAADPARMNKPAALGLLTLLIILVAMAYGPIAAQLVELFPTRIRYTSLSLPYHIGNGWFGGFLPPLAFAMVAASGNIYFGLWYPIAVALMTVVVGFFLVPETKDRNIYASD
ncbi:MFS transporter [Rhodoblastus acidophilus]|uniref:MFS transporter n=1 Tax=Candidatus Rhodoblastus alkanivorans TaxID=2954117 RepID=A0ABS9Z7W9_9HYPH|nr:MFS transporter [Candidatus Rhodoblastus alkanivorans]MCI4679661.1 MFS transporter [Candidatus Rhodoblastus alkanivorans]MCI4683697.1 MFS transporter [Candidatus Rhodoblastus alkanivorans]MDI4641014.1 MFS transporter [Rhodoblastus acidophilus]